MRQIESRDSGTVPGLSGILVPKNRDLLSRRILVAGSHRFLSRSRLSPGFESRSRSQSRGFAGPGTGSPQIPGQAPIPGFHATSEKLYKHFDLLFIIFMF